MTNFFDSPTPDQCVRSTTTNILTNVPLEKILSKQILSNPVNNELPGPPKLVRSKATTSLDGQRKYFQ